MKNVKLKSLGAFLTVLFSVAVCNTGWTKSVEDKAKEAVDKVADSIKGSIDRFGDNIEAIQRYLENYHWKGIIQEVAFSDGVTLKYMNLNGHSRVVVARPGERIEGDVLCDLDPNRCSSLSFYRVVLGIKGVGAQTTIGNELGIFAGESREKFTLIAPSKPGLYEIRFRLVENVLEANALKAWVDSKGNEPDGTTTVGLIYVK